MAIRAPDRAKKFLDKCWCSTWQHKPTKHVLHKQKQKIILQNQLENSTDMSVASARFPTMSCGAHMYYLDSDHKPNLPRNVKSGGRIDSRLAHIGEVVTDGHRNLQNI